MSQAPTNEAQVTIVKDGEVVVTWNDAHRGDFRWGNSKWEQEHPRSGLRARVDKMRQHAYNYGDSLYPYTYSVLKNGTFRFHHRSHIEIDVDRRTEEDVEVFRGDHYIHQDFEKRVKRTRVVI